MPSTRAPSYWPRSIDWIPARLTASAFAVVGNFEDAIYAWRNFANRWEDEAAGIILAAGGGAGWLAHARLQQLQARLQQHGSTLVCRYGWADEALPALAAELGAQALEALGDGGDVLAGHSLVQHGIGQGKRWLHYQ